MLGYAILAIELEDLDAAARLLARDGRGHLHRSMP